MVRNTYILTKLFCNFYCVLKLWILIRNRDVGWEEFLNANCPSFFVNVLHAYISHNYPAVVDIILYFRIHTESWIIENVLTFANQFSRRWESLKRQIKPGVFLFYTNILVLSCLVARCCCCSEYNLNEPPLKLKHLIAEWQFQNFLMSTLHVGVQLHCHTQSLVLCRLNFFFKFIIIISFYQSLI